MITSHIFLVLYANFTESLRFMDKHALSLISEGTYFIYLLYVHQIRFGKINKSKPTKMEVLLDSTSQGSGMLFYFSKWVSVRQAFDRSPQALVDKFKFVYKTVQQLCINSVKG